MKSPCCKCCYDIDLRPIDLLFPARLDDAGQEFLVAHGLDLVTLGELRHGAIRLANGLVKIQHRCQHLLPSDYCGIYDERPKICRDYDCGARTGADACNCVQQSA